MEKKELNDGEVKVYTHIEGGTNNDPNITEGKKKFIFSATGNIMVATTEEEASALEGDVRDVFNEVSVFFAAMSKAISTTRRPGSDENYTIYNYDALEKVIDGSGCFVHCTQEDIDYTSSSFGAEFSRELVTALLGLPIGGGSLSFAQAMISSIGQEALKISKEKERSDSRVGNIVFVCECLFGMPVISATVVYIDSGAETEAITAGPCVKTSKTSVNMKMHKDVYMFVTPSFIKNYAKDLDSVVKSEGYGEFVAYLQSLLTSDIVYVGAYDQSGKTKVEDVLVLGETYVIQGRNFGAETGTLTLGGQVMTINSWNDDRVEFMVAGKETADAQSLDMKTKDGNIKSLGLYAIKKSE